MHYVAKNFLAHLYTCTLVHCTALVALFPSAECTMVHWVKNAPKNAEGGSFDRDWDRSALNFEVFEGNVCFRTNANLKMFTFA